MSEELSSSQQGERGRLSELALLLLGLCAKVALAGARCASSFLVSIYLVTLMMGSLKRFQPPCWDMVKVCP